MGEITEIYVLFNESYGEIVTTASKESLLIPILKDELKGYGYSDEQIEDMIKDGEYADIFRIDCGNFEG